MARFSLYYWPIPYRGIFIRNILAYSGQNWDEHAADEVIALKNAPVQDQPLPFMAPPLLHDSAHLIWVSQLPAIITYLGEALDLTPADISSKTTVMKTILDANDVIDELTRHGGAQMWDAESWAAFRDHRLPRWMDIFEETARRHHVQPNAGWYLNTESPSTADLIVYSLWHTMRAKLPGFDKMLSGQAPLISGLCDRMAALPALQSVMAETQDDTYCSGEIEKSIRSMLGSSRAIAGFR